MSFPDPPCRTGLVLGKFLPPTLGHQYLLDFAQAYVDRLSVLVCSLKREPIPGELRTAWVREMCPAAEVFHVDDENPQEPADHPEFWRIWRETIRRRLPLGPDLVFTSEDYGDELARQLGARHVIVDKARELVPISGTELRGGPLAHWEQLPACVRPHFVKRVVVHGPESTGKTTLCRRLAEHYRTVWVSEYARGMLDHQWSQRPADAGPASPGATCEPGDIPRIARGHMASEEALARQANRVLFLDTDLVLTTIYSRLFFGGVPEWIPRAAAEARRDLYLVTDIDVPWVADEQRDLPHAREEMRAKCLAELDAQGRRYVLIQGSWDERFERARQAIDALLAS